jgi:MarR family transcriptional regulator for hemolysin
MVSIIDTLSEEGFVYRETNTADRREHLLKVTEKARRAVPEIVHAFENMNNHVTEDIPEEDMLVFYNVLFKMQENLGNFQSQ